jgi:hypothetical protein
MCPNELILSTNGIFEEGLRYSLTIQLYCFVALSRTFLTSSVTFSFIVLERNPSHGASAVDIILLDLFLAVS